MTRTDPSPAIEWLIGALSEQGVTATPSKIERIQRAALGPRPLAHRSDRLSGSELWPQGTVDHYAALIPLIRQRHAATEIAAITMIGWGFPIDMGLLRKSYGRAYSLGDLEDRADDLLDHYQNRGMSLFKSAMAHVRTHGMANGRDASDLADDLIRAALSYSCGMARTEQIRLMLAAALPKYSQAPEAVVNWVLQLFDRLQSEFALPKLLETVNEASTEDLLRFQPTAATELDMNIKHLGGFEPGCTDCNERRGFMIGTSIPVHVRLAVLDWEHWVDELATTVPPGFET
jgi:hypothetical protein